MTLLKTCFLYTLLLLSLLVTSSNSSGQIFPATANVQLKPPYSLYLNDYYDPMSDNLKIVLVFNDNTEPFWEVKLRMRIESNNVRIITKEGYTPPAPITVTSGVPLILSGSELEDYFNYNTILVEGVSVQALLKNGRLPEGFYTFCFEVLDYYSGKVLSKKSCANAWLKLNDPPRIITPACGAALSPMLTQHNFQWQLFNTKSPNSLSGPEYKLFIYEMLDPTANPLTAFTNGNFLQVFESDYLQTPYFIYDLAAPPLELGKRYFYRVQATDPNGKDAFKNDGFSEVCSFYYGYPEGGKIKLISPGSGNNVDKSGFQWTAPDNKQKGQAMEYLLKIAEKKESQTAEEAFEQNKPLFTKKLPPTTSDKNQFFSLPPSLLGESEYAGGVIAFSGQQQVAQSDVVSFNGSSSEEKAPGSVVVGENCLAAEIKIKQSSNNSEYTFVNASTSSTAPIEVQRWSIEFYPAGSDTQSAGSGNTIFDYTAPVSPTTSDNASTASGNDPTTSGNVPTTINNAPATSGNAPTTNGNAPTTNGNAPTTNSNSSPTTSDSPEVTVTAEYWNASSRYCDKTESETIFSKETGLMDDDSYNNIKVEFEKELLNAENFFVIDPNNYYFDIHLINLPNTPEQVIKDRFSQLEAIAKAHGFTKIRHHTEISTNNQECAGIKTGNNQIILDNENHNEGGADYQYTNTPLIDTKHTLLFEHIFHNNHQNKMNYLKKIKSALANNNTTSMDLTYTKDEEQKWKNVGQESWMKEWKIRVWDEKEMKSHFDKTINAIKNTKKGKKIGEIVLQPKHIYIGKYSFKGITYPIAIYANGSNPNMTNLFTKIQVMEVTDLNDKENKKHIYYGECSTIPFLTNQKKYLLIGLYEENKESPSVIIQTQAFTEYTGEKWLEHLNILGMPPIEAKDLADGGVIFVNGEVGQFTFMGMVIGKKNSSNRASVNYWSKAFVIKVLKAFKESNHLYYDGDRNSMASQRKELGEKKAKEDFIEMIENKGDNKITKTIKVVSHSKGAAWAAGYIEGWNELRNSKTYKDNFDGGGGKVEFSLMLAAHHDLLLSHKKLMLLPFHEVVNHTLLFSLENPKGVNVNIHHQWDVFSAPVLGDVWNYKTDSKQWANETLDLHLPEGFHFEAEDVIKAYMENKEKNVLLELILKNAAEKASKQFYDRKTQLYVVD